MKILVYDDNPDFGGHQIMACHGIEALIETAGTEVILMYNPANRKLIQAVEHLPTLRILEANVRLFQSMEPDLILCIQGDIAQSSAGIRAARKANIECASYLALPHRLSDMGAKLGAIRDCLNAKWFNAPDRFITISESMKQIMLDRGCKKPISIVPNGIPKPLLMKQGKDVSHPSPCTLGLAGRIEFNQKQQDFLVRALLHHPKTFAGCSLKIVGSGPDEKELRTLIGDASNITLTPWQENMDRFFDEIDILVIPSRFEGVPLVMLEALARGIPVLGSRRDGMEDLLPHEWTFTTEDSSSLASTLSSVREMWSHKIEALQNRVLCEHSIDTFKQNFVRAVTTPCAS